MAKKSCHSNLLRWWEKSRSSFFPGQLKFLPLGTAYSSYSCGLDLYLGLFVSELCFCTYQDTSLVCYDEARLLEHALLHPRELPKSIRSSVLPPAGLATPGRLAQENQILAHSPISAACISTPFVSQLLSKIPCFPPAIPFLPQRLPFDPESSRPLWRSGSTLELYSSRCPLCRRLVLTAE